MNNLLDTREIAVNLKSTALGKTNRVSAFIIQRKLTEILLKDPWKCFPLPLLVEWHTAAIDFFRLV